ncbi:MAG: choice-of-anchor I family protein [Acidobacteria bacterium]|nr:choice-of-anchor I family protein [Acidobacteriota bacterium]
MKTTVLSTLVIVLTLSHTAPGQIRLRQIGRVATGMYNSGGAEISAYEPTTQRLFTVNGGTKSIDVVDLSNPARPVKLFSIPTAPYGGGANSVAIRGGIIAAAVEATPKTDPGSVVFFDTDGNLLRRLTIGALPDMLTFTPDGRFLLIANEGEPSDDYKIDPEGSVSIVDMGKPVGFLSQSDVRTVSFTEFNGAKLDPSIRVFGPGSTAAQDFEPEYIAVSADSKTAYVTIQEANAVAVVDIATAKVTRLIGLGFKDHSLAANKLDVSDRDNQINLANWPLFGVYMPDAIATFTAGGETYLVMANEGDSRAYTGFNEEVRVSELKLDATAFPNGDALKANAQMGRLRVTKTLGDTDNDGDYDALYAFGARSFSIRSTTGAIVYDSGSEFEEITAKAYPTRFNASNDSDTFDSRSAGKGPEPEGIAVGVIDGRTYAFIGLERMGGVMVYDVTEPKSPKHIQYWNNRLLRDKVSADDDLGPEGVLFIPAADAPNNQPLLIVSNEISGSIQILAIEKQ